LANSEMQSAKRRRKKTCLRLISVKNENARDLSKSYKYVQCPWWWHQNEKKHYNSYNVLLTGNNSIGNSGKKQRSKYSSLENWTPHRATEHHMPYGIRQCYLPPDAGEWAQP